MNELTKEQLAMFFSGDYDHLTCKEFRELTPKPKFTVGQVVYCMDLEDDQPAGFYAPESQLTDIGVRDARPLNQAEVGPDWIPSSAVPGYKIAVEALERVTNHPSTNRERLKIIAEDALSRIKEAGTDCWVPCAESYPKIMVQLGLLQWLQACRDGGEVITGDIAAKLLDTFDSRIKELGGDGE